MNLARLTFGYCVCWGTTTRESAVVISRIGTTMYSRKPERLERNESAPCSAQGNS
jgi:hypothetical protein